MYYIRSECSFDSAHFLKGYIGKCSNLHGHRWRVVVELAAERLSEEEQTRGMVLDFGDLKTLLKDLCDNLDHCLIYESGSLREKTGAGKAVIWMPTYRKSPVGRLSTDVQLGDTGLRC